VTKVDKGGDRPDLKKIYDVGKDGLRFASALFGPIVFCVNSS
jgi:hypothetical protein